MGLFSPAQCVGYIALFLGITAFLQKTDRRLKFMIGSQGLVYAVHFLLLGNLPASGSSFISCVRTFLALRYRSLWLAAAIVVFSIAMGGVLVGSGAGWLPILASCAATVAIFTLDGVPLRYVLLVCTILWLANNIITGSIGGVVLEVFVLSANAWTILRMSQQPAAAVRQWSAGSEAQR
jgi:hypothetical protein